MSEFLKAADDARRLLRGFKAFEEVAKALELAGVADQRKAEAESKLAFLLVQIETAQAEADEKAAKHAADEAAAKQRADEIVAAAGAKALQIVADAQTTAANAELQAASVTRAAEERLALANAEVAVVQSSREDLAAEVKDLEERAEKARKYLAKLAG